MLAADSFSEVYAARVGSVLTLDFSSPPKMSLQMALVSVSADESIITQLQARNGLFLLLLLASASGLRRPG